jgi:hypothetical protein
MEYFFPSPWRKNPLWDTATSLSRLHDHTQAYKVPKSIRFLRTSDQPDALDRVDAGIAM